MPNVYEKLGVRTIINASGPSTRLSGSIMPPEVAEAMREASQWTSSSSSGIPPSLIDKGRLPGAPQHGIGRPCKVGKEEIIGLLTALRLFVQEDPEARRRRWLALMEALIAALRGTPHTKVELTTDRRSAEIPTVQLTLDEGASGTSALELVKRLQDGDPSIHANPSRVRDGVVLFGPMCLKDGEPELIGKRLRELLQ